MNNNIIKKYDGYVFVQTQCVLTHLFPLHRIHLTTQESFTQNL